MTNKFKRNNLAYELIGRNKRRIDDQSKPASSEIIDNFRDLESLHKK